MTKQAGIYNAQNEYTTIDLDMRHTRIVRVVALKDHEFSRYFLCSTYRQTPLCELDESKARIVLLLSCEHLFFFFFFLSLSEWFEVSA